MTVRRGLGDQQSAASGLRHWVWASGNGWERQKDLHNLRLLRSPGHRGAEARDAPSGCDPNGTRLEYLRRRERRQRPHHWSRLHYPEKKKNTLNDINAPHLDGGQFGLFTGFAIFPFTCNLLWNCRTIPERLRHQLSPISLRIFGQPFTFWRMYRPLFIRNMSRRAGSRYNIDFVCRFESRRSMTVTIWIENGVSSVSGGSVPCDCCSGLEFFWKMCSKVSLYSKAYSRSENTLTNASPILSPTAAISCLISFRQTSSYLLDAVQDFKVPRHVLVCQG
nr:hypothetical protein Iba_chr01bCG4770 [Ipomoea batatas]